jgi:3-oxoacyl-[acyl-carrier-protein] synthase-1
MSRYALTALGMVNALGVSLAEISERLFKGRPDWLTAHCLRTTGKTVPVGRVHEPLPNLPAHLGPYQCRNHALAFLAYQQIHETVATLRQRIGPERLGVIIGTSTSGIDASENAFFQWRANGSLPDGYNFRTQHEMGALSEFLAGLAGAKGPAYTVSTACSSSAKVFASAKSLLDLGICDAVIVGGVDALCHLTLNGFEALDSLSREVSNPMSRNREGLNIGEGAALFILSCEAGPIRLLGVGETSDAHHISAPDPNGQAAEAAMRLALLDAELEPADVHYVNLHGTGTPQNDAMEAAAVNRVFGRIHASSTKPLVGHCLGAAGAMEVGFCWLALKQVGGDRMALPPHHWDEVADEKLPSLNLVRPNSSIKHNGAVRLLSNSFAFGGSNCAVLIGTGGNAASVSVAPRGGESGAVFHLRDWSAWSPGLPDRRAWENWLREKRPVAIRPGTPPCARIHPLLRRRCGPLVRMVLEAALAVCDSAGIDPSQVHHVHCSRYGEIATTRQLFDSLNDCQPLSPSRFSNSVHHTPSAYFDLAVKNTLLSRSISAGDYGLACSILEVWGLLRKAPQVPVLLTLADEPPPEPFNLAVVPSPMPYAVAFLFATGHEDGGQTIHFKRSPGLESPPTVTGCIPVIDFLQWLAGSETHFRTPTNFGNWMWNK